MREVLIAGANQIGIVLTEKQIEMFLKYMELVQEWNQKFNLTAITDAKEIIIKHFLDSLLLKDYVTSEGTLADIGTGAGFPGLPLKIIFPQLKVTLVDSLNKRVKFLAEVVNCLDLQGVECIHGRAEDLGRNPLYREKYDFVVARAVSRMSVLCELCLPLVKIGGIFIAAKGPSVHEEVTQATWAVDLLGGKVREVKEASLPLIGDARSFVVVDKVRKTSNEFPRKAGTAEKKPLEKS